MHCDVSVERYQYRRRGGCRKEGGQRGKGGGDCIMQRLQSAITSTSERAGCGWFLGLPPGKRRGYGERSGGEKTERRGCDEPERYSGGRRGRVRVGAAGTGWWCERGRAGGTGTIRRGALGGLHCVAGWRWCKWRSTRGAG